VLLGALEELKQTDETVYKSDVKKLHETAIGRMARIEEELLKAMKPPEPEDKRAGRKIQRTGQTTPAIYKLRIPGDCKIPWCYISAIDGNDFMQGFYRGAYPRRSKYAKWGPGRKYTDKEHAANEVIAWMWRKHAQALAKEKHQEELDAAKDMPPIQEMDFYKRILEQFGLADQEEDEDSGEEDQPGREEDRLCDEAEVSKAKAKTKAKAKAKSKEQMGHEAPEGPKAKAKAKGRAKAIPAIPLPPPPELPGSIAPAAVVADALGSVPPEGPAARSIEFARFQDLPRLQRKTCAQHQGTRRMDYFWRRLPLFWWALLWSTGPA